VRILICAALAAVGLLASPAEAQEQCTSVEIERVRHRQVELFDLHGTLVTRVSRRELGEVTRAVECPSAPNFLGIVSQGRRWLVRRTALQVRGPDMTLPICAPGEYESYIQRNASSSGAGLPPCRRATE
jgi:hypothetical protein